MYTHFAQVACEKQEEVRREQQQANAAPQVSFLHQGIEQLHQSIEHCI
jgi:hypothetical protein